jgi:hypothetical protein
VIAEVLLWIGLAPSVMRVLVQPRGEAAER